ncbi:LuxR C-terminal-related transcriptional regulator [Mycobacterium sp. SMC-4]|uniref:LuxR C-terminal-related transcriptional regulator n=1 Tax=Mycobacterium sp. SMC-4 TaxID=2857059 RepID=UPI003CFDED22
MSTPDMSYPHADHAVIRSTVVMDDEILRHGLVHVVSQVDGITCVGDAGCDTGFAARITALRPDVVLLGASQFPCVRAAVNDIRPAPKLIVVIDPGRRSADLVDLVRAGADAIIDRRAPSAEVRRALRRVVAGQLVLDESSAHALMVHIRASMHPDESAHVRVLTMREREVLTLLADGLDNRGIAAKLFIAETTVKFHLRNIMDKYGVHRRAALVSAALRDGTVRPSGS